VLYVSALVAYDGTAYRGFQYQANAATVQCELEAALDKVVERGGRVSGAGRTDAGVHASGQVAAVRVQWQHDLPSLQRAWNVNLPNDVAVRSVRPAPEDFHPRFSAISRTYRYTVWQSDSAAQAAPRRSPLTDRFGWYTARPLDLEAMQAASRALIGSHDFATFGQPTQGESTVRIVHAAEWQIVREDLPRLGDYPGHRLVFTITANAFLRHMVRCLVGSLLLVGRGEWSPSDLVDALGARNRSQSAPPAAPQGLVLERVSYPPALDALVHGTGACSTADQ
jgi:tRNA pseudouridine38-40 synthase